MPPHLPLINQLRSLYIHSNVLLWIKEYLASRLQFTDTNNKHSNRTGLTSGVPQGACPLLSLLLICINDLPDGSLPNIRLFADDCVVYRAIIKINDSLDLQNEL